MSQTVTTVADLARRAAEYGNFMGTLRRLPGAANGYQQYLARYMANAGRGAGPGMYNWVAAGPGHVLGRAGNAAAAGAGAGAEALLNVPAHVAQMSPYVEVLPRPFTAEEYAELERQGIPLPTTTRYLQEQGLIRRPDEALQPESILRRGLGVLALGGLLTGNPGAAAAGTGGLIVHDAFQGPALGPSQLRIPRATRRASFSNRAAVRPFHNRDPTYAVSTGYGTNSTARTLNVRNNRYPSRPSSRIANRAIATLGYPPELDPNDERREGPSGAMRYPNGNRTRNNNRSNRNYRRNVARDPWIQNPRVAEAVARQRAAGVEVDQKIAAATNAMLAERAAAAAAPAAAAAAAAPVAAAPPAPASSSSSSSSSGSFFNRFFSFGGTRRYHKNKRAHTMRKIINKH